MDDSGVVRLQHDGREWLHVTGTDGAGIGWMCLNPPALYCLVPGREHELRWRVASWLGASIDAMPQPISPSVVPSANPSTTVVHEASLASSVIPGPAVPDLAANVAGQGIRQKAIDAKAEAPVRTVARACNWRTHR